MQKKFFQNLGRNIHERYQVKITPKAKDDMEEIYPWKKQIPESYEKSRKRRFPKKLKNFQQNELYTRIIPHEINRALCGEITEEEALSNMEMHIKSKSEV